jgi:two-component system, OmpR family, phosphate regulon sensor histidine kinase PhoR
MNRRPLIWKLLPTYLAVTVFAVIAVGWYSAHSMRTFFLTHARDDLELRARLLLRDLPDTFPDTDPDSLQHLCMVLDTIAYSRITLIDNAGRVLADSERDPKFMDNHSQRPEVKEALLGRHGMSVRYSIDMRRDMIYFAQPVWRAGKVVGVIRTSLAITTLYEALDTLKVRIALGGLVVTILATVLTLIFSRRVSRPIKEMVRGAEEYAAGDFSHKLYAPDTTELATLTDALNRMAARLEEKIRELTVQRNEQQAIL